VLLALASNAILKIVLAALTGIPAFTLRVAATFSFWGAIGTATWWIAAKI